MPCLQFLSGSRDQQVEDLNPQASLVVGSGEAAHIRVTDPGVEGNHCQVYPAGGQFWLQDLGAGPTILNLRRIASATEGLNNGDVFILGRTFVKFWADRPPAGGGGGGGGGAGDAALRAELDAAKQAKEQAEAQAAQTKQQAAEALNQAKEKAKAEITRLRDELAKAQEGAKGQERAEAELKTVRGELETARGQLADTRGELEGAQRERDETRTALEAARAETAQAHDEARTQVETARAEAEAAAAKARAEAEASRAELEGALGAARAALAVHEARERSGRRDRFAALRARSDLGAILDALDLPQALRLRLHEAVDAEVDREVLARSAGSVVPVRGLRAPGSDRDLEADLLAARRHAERVAAARQLGLHEVDGAELERLLALARA